MPKYTLQELKDKKIAIRCDSQEEADKVKQFAINGGEKKVGEEYRWVERNPFFQVNPFDKVFGFFCNEFANYSKLPASKFFLEDEPKSTPEPIPTEYAVLTNATEAAKKQIAEFEQVLAQIKIDAMKLGTRDLARLIKALNVI